MGLTIQSHPDRFEVVPYLNEADPFVVVKAHEGDASASLFLRSADLCDALIAVAVEAKRLLDPPAPLPDKCSWHGGEGSSGPGCDECADEDERRVEASGIRDVTGQISALEAESQAAVL